ncbi:MAG: ribosome biogenesis factor YjgA [Aquabacterium sp.]|jgi:ribosome-associated protein|uniref:ribosome biogenesis factor YjgA n=1 Tax=Aquabacterium sp. TaxID=1872578 RepID=UPI002A35F25A|nr:ribosome biogenesis factor YjgA [Aquabacterium sp.]MDX9842131.1 ribosome biogenesis factor YjgA [Aquabacterium sp.]
MNSKHSPSHDGYDPEDDLDDRPPSRSMLKRASQALQALGQQLLDMPESRLVEIDMPERLRDALADYKKTRSFEGKRRQLQFIGKVMREVDAEPLREAVAQYQLGHAHNALALHQAERWRAELIADDKDAVTRWVADFPDTDVQQLRTLIRNARKDASLDPEKRNGRAFRELFQFIKRAMEAQEKGAEPDQGETA